MTSTRIIALVGTVAALAGLGPAFREARTASRINTSLIAALSRQDSLRKEVEQLDRHRADLVSSLTPWRRKKTEISAATNSPAHADSPEARLRQRRGLQAVMNLRYRPIFTQLGLSADQVEQAENIMIKYQAALEDINTAATNQGMPQGDPAVAKLRQAELTQSNSDLAALFGADGFAQYQEYNRSAPAGQFVNRVAGLALGADPLSAAQGEQLTQILASASPEYQKGGTMNLDTIDWTTAEAQAQKVLSAQQFAALQSADSDFQVRSQLSQLTSVLAKQSP